jgi:hypothetical protein
LTEFGKLVGPLAQSVLYPQSETHDASPKAISGRTSYRRVCLAFHPYPQVIPQVFNLGGFGPPRGLTLASPCPWIAHSASGLGHATSRPIQKAGGQDPKIPPTACKPTVSGSISLPSPGYFSPFPHGTGPLSVTREYLALRGGPRRFTRNILRDTWEHRQE